VITVGMLYGPGAEVVERGVDVVGGAASCDRLEHADTVRRTTPPSARSVRLIASLIPWHTGDERRKGQNHRIRRLRGRCRSQKIANAPVDPMRVDPLSRYLRKVDLTRQRTGIRPISVAR